MHVREGKSVFIEESQGERPCHKGTMLSEIASNKTDDEEDIGMSSKTDDGGNNTMLRFQQEMERLLSRPQKLSQHNEWI